VLAAAVVLAAPRAQAHPDTVTYAAYAAATMLIPNGVGTEALDRPGTPPDWRGLLTWATQIPLQPLEEGPHRALFGVDLIFARTGRTFWDTGVRGRAGYRYLWRERLALGLNLSYDAESRLSVGGEIGLFTSSYPRATVILRPELGLRDRSPRVALVIGWTVI
jgi:hypothetical protein